MKTKTGNKPPSGPNVNVTLAQATPEANPLSGKHFPCSVCGNALGICFTRKSKPYTTCLVCGIQTFFRGKLGIKRLVELVNSGVFLSGNGFKSESPVILYNRIQQLREQKKALSEKQSILIRDLALENAIQVLENEISRLQNELAKQAELGKMAPNANGESKK